VDSGGFHTQERWLEEGLWASESLVSDGDDLSVRQFVRLSETSKSGKTIIKQNAKTEKKN
jgi:hypothetical protein